MRRCGVCLVVVVLAGCASSGSGDTAEAACQRKAYDDPTVKLLTIQNLGVAAAADPSAQFEYRKALHDATDACLRQKGVQVRGGVEPVEKQ